MRGPAVFEAGAIPPPEGVDEMSRVRSAEQGLYTVRVRARRVWRRVRRAARRAAAARDRAESARRPRQPRASRRRRRRPSTGDGAGHPDADPGRVLPRRRRGGASRSRAATASRCASSPTRPSAGTSSSSCSTAIVEDEGQSVVCWRDVPVDPAFAGRTAAAAAPLVRQLVVAASDALADQDAFERKLYVIRRRFELEGGADAIIPSFSSRTIVYKGMLTAPQLRGYYPDLQDERTATALALVHSRFSTNTFPSWELAHPYRMIAHNGEINTVRGNINWMRARESQLASELFGDDLHKVLPLVQEGGSDSAVVRQRARAARARRPLAAARDDDDDPRGDGRARRSAAGAARVLRLPPVPDGGLGRPRRGVVHRRARDRLDARPQRPAAGSLARDARRLGRARLRGRRARHPCREHPPQGPAAARQALPRRPRAGTDRPRRRGQARDRHPAAVRRVVRPRGRAARRPAAADAARDADRVPAPAADRVRLLARGHEGDPGAARAQRRGGGQLDGQRHAPRGPLRPPPAHLLVLQAAVRAGDEPADRLDPRGDRDEPAGEHRLREEPLRRDARARAPARAARRRSCSTPSSSSCARCTRRSSRRARST